MAVLVPAEWIYLSWASDVADRAPPQFYYKEWIDLHATDEFADFVNWMRAQLDTIGPSLPADRKAADAARFNLDFGFDVLESQLEGFQSVAFTLLPDFVKRPIDYLFGYGFLST